MLFPPSSSDPTVGRLPPSTPMWLILATFVLGLFLNTLPVPLGLYGLCPDFLLTTLVFWAVFESTKAGILTSWTLGLFMDVMHGTLLSQHSLCYAFSTLLALLLKRRLFRFGPFYQSLHIMPIIFLGHAGVYWISSLRDNQADFPFYLLIGDSWVIPLWVFGCYWIFRWRQHTIHTLD